MSQSICSRKISMLMYRLFIGVTRGNDGIGSITTLTALALWRCMLVVCCPAKRSTAFTNSSGRLGRRQAALLLTLIWTYSLAVTCPPLLGWGRYDREAAHISCSVNWESKMDNNRSYILYMFTFGLIVPLAAIVVSYVSILRVIRKTSIIKRKTMMTLQSTRTTPNQPSQHNRSRLSPASGTTPTDAQMNATNNNNQQHSDAAEKRVTIMVACMIGAFMAAWTPYSIMALIETFYGVNSSDRVTSNDATSEGLVNEVFVGHITPALATVPSLFAKTSAVINPLIYGLLNTQFRSAWERFTVRCLGRQPRHHHHNRRRRHNDSNCPDTVAVTNERHNLRRFLGLQPTQTIHLPMKDIAPSSSVYVMVTRAVSDTSPPTSPTSQWHPHQDQTPNGDSSHHEVIQDNKPNKESNSPRRQHHEVSDRSLWLTNSCVPSLLLPCSPATPSSPSPPLAPPDVEPRRSAVAAKELPNRCSLLVRHRPNQWSQQPVSLVVVRLLSDSTSRYNDDIDDSVLETSIDVDSVSPKTRTPEIAQEPPVTDGNTVPGSLSPVRDGPS